MKRVLLVLLIPVILIVFASYQNNNNISLIISQLKYSDSIKEGDLEYQVNLFNVLPAAEAIFRGKEPTTIDQEPVEHLSAVASTANYFSRLFTARVYLDSYLRLADQNPLLFREKIMIKGKESDDKQVHYDQDAHIMTIDGTQRQILPSTHDPLSCMNALRNMDFSKINEVELNINTNQKNYILKGEVRPRRIKVEQDEYQLYILKARIQRRDKNPYHKTGITIVFLKSERNLPILVKVFASGAVINAKLNKVTP